MTNRLLTLAEITGYTPGELIMAQDARTLKVVGEYLGKRVDSFAFTGMEGYLLVPKSDIAAFNRGEMPGGAA